MWGVCACWCPWGSGLCGRAAVRCCCTQGWGVWCGWGGGEEVAEGLQVRALVLGPHVGVGGVERGGRGS